MLPIIIVGLVVIAIVSILVIVALFYKKTERAECNAKILYKLMDKIKQSK